MTVELEVRCGDSRCKRTRLYRARAPLALVPALVIAFHANHEGHPLELVIDGEHYAPGIEDSERVLIVCRCQRHRHARLELVTTMGLAAFAILEFHTQHGACPVVVQIAHHEVGP